MFTFKRPDRFCRRTKFNVTGCLFLSRNSDFSFILQEDVTEIRVSSLLSCNVDNVCVGRRFRIWPGATARRWTTASLKPGRACGPTRRDGDGRAGSYSTLH